jgi:hypothetical protein
MSKKKNKEMAFDEEIPDIVTSSFTIVAGNEHAVFSLLNLGSIYDNLVIGESTDATFTSIKTEILITGIYAFSAQCLLFESKSSSTFTGTSAAAGTTLRSVLETATAGTNPYFEIQHIKPANLIQARKDPAGARWAYRINTNLARAITKWSKLPLGESDPGPTDKTQLLLLAHVCTVGAADNVISFTVTTNSRYKLLQDIHFLSTLSPKKAY